MADLRLVGVHDDGEHLLLSGTDGEIYLLPIDEALRLATSRSPHQQRPTPSETTLSPREIQSQIRQGASAEEVAEGSGLSLEQVRRYEGPVLAEREHIAQLARKVEVASGSNAGEAAKSIFGENPVSLEEMVVHRLGSFGIDPATLVWDAWRVHDGSWAVTADFEPSETRASTSIGESTPARWTFHTARKSLFNANRWAQQLSELEPVDGPVPERRLSAVADRPFDFETDTAESAIEHDITGTEQSADSSEDPDRQQGPHGLLDMLRSRRGQRLGFDEDGDDQLAQFLGSSHQGSHPLGEFMHDPDNYSETSQGDSETDVVGNSSEDNDLPELPEPVHEKKRLRSIPFLSLAQNNQGHAEDSPVGVNEVSSLTREITVSGEPRSVFKGASADLAAAASPSESSEHPASTGDTPEAPTDTEVAHRLERKATAKPKRSSVPSWDEIVFGTKGD